MKNIRAGIILLLVGSSCPTPQFRLSLGQLLGAVDNSSQQNNNKNQRVDPLEVAGNLFGQILDNTDVRIAPDGTTLEVKDQFGQAADTSEDCDGGGIAQVGARRGSGGCDCWEVGTDYPGGDLRRVTNPRQVSSVSECQALCRNTSDCQHFTYQRKRGRPGTTNCWLKNSNSRRSSNADDGIPWCSTLTDSEGNHVGGQGKWGHCPDSCEADVDVTVVGSASNTDLDKIPWIKNGALPSLPTGVLGAAAGISQNDVKNEFFSLGLNQPNTPFQTCPAIGNSQGRCRHLHHCVIPQFFNFFNFLSNVCIIQGRFIGVCCPETAATTQATTTTQVTNQTPNAKRPTNSAALTRECGVNAKRFTTRVVGGRPADPDEWPWLAALIRKGNPGHGQYCGATLISDTHVLTAAHCVDQFRKEDILVRLGEYDFNQTGETGDETFSVAAMKLHENYDSVRNENDIAVIRLDRPATFSKSIWPICLPDTSNQFTNDEAFVIGWGATDSGGLVSDILLEVNVRVWENSECAKNYANLNRVVTDTMLCAGRPGKNSCPETLTIAYNVFVTKTSMTSS